MRVIKEYKAIVKITGGKDSLGIKDQDFVWSSDKAEEAFSWAINFAEGYTTALASGNNAILFGSPYVKSLDGYRWWTRSGFEIKVVNKDGKVVRKPEDLIKDSVD